MAGAEPGRETGGKRPSNRTVRTAAVAPDRTPAIPLPPGAIAPARGPR